MGQSNVTPPQMLTDKEKKKGFTCAIYKQSHTYHGWEDAEIFFENDMSVHLGCFKKHYLKLLTEIREAADKIQSVLDWESTGKLPGPKSCSEILEEVKTSLQGCFIAE